MTIRHYQKRMMKMNHSGTNDDRVQIFTPIKAMRKKCLDCCCGSPQEVKLCPVRDCSLYPYRLGKHPKRTGTKGRINPGLQKIHQIAGEEIANKRE
jgi:hypothetical protein